MNKKIVAPCGIDCFNCEVFKDNVTEEFQARLSQATKIPKEMITCDGCVDGNICLFLKAAGKPCKTADYAREKGVDFCHECGSFPCGLLMPLAKGSEKYPHNLKLYNLCVMKKIGFNKFCEQAKDIRDTYYGRDFAIGEGASDE